MSDERDPAGAEQETAHEASPGRHADQATAHELAPGAVRRERELPVSTDNAWRLLEDADGLSRWLADEVDVRVAPGEVGTLREGDTERSILVEEVEQGRRVALRWWTDPERRPGADRAAEDAAVVDLTLEPTGDDSCRLVVTEIPLRLVAAPDSLPVAWTFPGTAGPSAGPQLALVCTA